jgi:molecular chaperone DnaK (HSP70)
MAKKNAPGFVVGIDLGTTNCAVACVDLSRKDCTVDMFPVLQTIAPGALEPRPTLPSFLYLADEKEFAKDALNLPWKGDGRAVGEFARGHGWKVPSRLVSSAKSWLCHSGIDRLSAVLPWQAPAEVAKVSPVEASAAYLGHIRAAWDQAHPTAPLAEQEVLITVPASFDAVARELTVKASKLAGLDQVTLLEEPQAAFYSWLGHAGDAWRKQLTVGDVVLVCDVGGGTTDFSLISVNESNGNLDLERVAVGDHILLGGDNMDLALAHMLRQKLQVQLDNWQFASLVHSARGAKEQLLCNDDLPSAPVVVLGRGSKVIGGSLKTELQRSDVTALLVDGFFPPCEFGAQPARARTVGLRELGLPFASDAGVTRHLSHFLSAHGKKATAVLFNGGVMKGKPLRQRVIETLDNWSDSPEDDLKVLSGTDYDLAVAHGAAYYGLVRRGKGVRIRGGTVRAYYIGIETAMPAVPGMAPPLKALCVAPFGMEEGTEAALPVGEFGLVVGEPAEFRFLASSTRREDRAGTMVEEVDENIAELAPVSTVLGDGEAGQLIPVRLQSKVTEVGTLELWCVEADPGKRAPRRWKLEYNVRDAA